MIVHLFSVIAVNQQKQKLASWVGTLLGPEATHAVLFLDRHDGQGSFEFIPLLRGVVGVLMWMGCWLVFENCIVDASIFDRLCVSY